MVATSVATSSVSNLDWRIDARLHNLGIGNHEAGQPIQAGYIQVHQSIVPRSAAEIY